MSSGPIRVGRLLARTDAEGPGTRAAVWVQGCTIRCPGCFNPHLWTARGGADHTPDELAAWVDPGVEGVTLLGGEPFDQAGPLARFAKLIRARGQTVMTFTGHRVEDLRAGGDPAAAALLDQTDLLVDGPFLRDRLDVDRPWVGSRNQRFHALTPRYAGLVADLASGPGDRLEIRVSPDGRVSVNGWATEAGLDVVLDGLGRTRGRPDPRR